MIDTDTAMRVIEQAFPELNYIIILHDPKTTEVVQVSNVPPEFQKKALEFNLKAMEEQSAEIVELKQPAKH